MKDADMRVLLAEVYETGQQHDAQQQERSKKMLNLEPETAQFLNILIRSSRRTQLLEIGTSNGYSTIWLAWAAAVTGGQVISIDHDAHKQALADNVLSHPNEIAGYLNALEALPRFDRVIVPIGKGLSVAYRSAAG